MRMSREDRKWQTFNRKLQKQMQESDFWGLGTTYYEMAYFLELQGKEYQHLMQKGYEMKLQAQKQSVLQYVKNKYVAKLELYANNDSCLECKGRSGNIVLLQEAASKSPLPIENCTFRPYGCRCTFLPMHD